MIKRGRGFYRGAVLVGQCVGRVVFDDLHVVLNGGGGGSGGGGGGGGRSAAALASVRCHVNTFVPVRNNQKRH